MFLSLFTEYEKEVFLLIHLVALALLAVRQ